MLLIQGTCQCQKTLILYCEVKPMNTKEKKKYKPKEQISKEDYSKKITYTQSDKESLDLLNIVELYLCRACIRL